MVGSPSRVSRLPVSLLCAGLAAGPVGAAQGEENIPVSKQPATSSTPRHPHPAPTGSPACLSCLLQRLPAPPPGTGETEAAAEARPPPLCPAPTGPGGEQAMVLPRSACQLRLLLANQGSPWCKRHPPVCLCDCHICLQGVDDELTVLRGCPLEGQEGGLPTAILLGTL